MKKNTQQQQAPRRQKPAKPAQPSAGRKSRSQRRREGKREARPPIARRIEGTDIVTDKYFASLIRRGQGSEDDFLSEIARAYVEELVNPFDGPLIGIPTTPVLNTRVDRLWTKGTAVTGTAGFGFVIFSPSAAATAPNFCTRSTTALYTLANINMVTAVGVVDQSSTSSFANADLGAVSTSIQARIVAAGLRCRCISSVLNMGGRAIGLHQPAHGSLTSYDENTMLTYEESASFQASESSTTDWFTVIYRPVDGTDFSFFTSAQPVATTNYMGWCIKAASAANPVEWEWQAFVEVEYQGAQVQHKTPSLSDPVGADAAHSIIAAVPHLKKPHKEKSEHMAAAAVRTANHYARSQTSHGGARDRHESSSSSGQSSGSSIWSGLGSVFTGALGALGAIL